MSEFQPGDDVVHDEYGHGTVKEHPEGRDGTYVYFHDQNTTTIWKVLSTRLKVVQSEEKQ